MGIRKVLHVYRTYFPDPPGGLQEAIRQIALATTHSGVQATVFALSPDPRPQVVSRSEATVFRAKSWAAPASCDLGAVGALGLFANLAKAADLIHYHFPWPFADVLHLSVNPLAPAVMTYHSDVVRQRLLGLVYKPVMQRMLGRMQRIVATSPAYSATSPVLSDAAVKDRVRVIPLGIDEASYPLGDGVGVLKRLGLAEGEPFVLFIGVLRYYKGLHTLIQAAAIIGAKIVIAGSGPERMSLKESADLNNLTNVIFAGQVSDGEKVELLKNCTAFVLPSHLRSEAFGMVLVEAEMFGKPVVSCEIGSGTSFVNADGETGFVVPPENPLALASAINTLIGDPVLAEQMGRAARSRYETMFSGPALGAAYTRLYDEVLG